MKMEKQSWRKVYFYFFILLILLILPNLFYFLLLKEKRITTVFLNNITLILAVILLMKYRYLRVFSYLILIVLVLNNGLDLTSIVFYRESFNVSMALSFLSTNSHEATEMALVYWYTIIFVILYGLSLYYPVKILKNHLSYRFLIIILMILLIKPFYSIYNLYQSNKIDENYSLYQKTGEQKFYHYLKFIPISTLSVFCEAGHYLSIVKKTSGQNYKYSSFYIRGNNVENIVVILGESASRSALGLYGNQINTTPFIEKRMKNLLVFENAIAPAAITNLALPLMLSKQLPSQFFSIQENQDNIISLANATKIWDTYWISNQERFGMFVNLFANINLKAKHMFWTAKGSYDETILPILEGVLKDKSTKRLIFIHLQGSHPDAAKRFPKNFDIFKTHNPQFINDYYNSIAYTDFIIDQVINQVEESNSLVIYVSDHGQSIENGAYRHSFTKRGVEVPFFIWHSNSVDEDLKMVGKVNTLISTSNLYNLLSDLMGVRGLNLKPKNEMIKVMNGELTPTYYSKLRSGN